MYIFMLHQSQYVFRLNWRTCPERRLFYVFPFFFVYKWLKLWQIFIQIYLPKLLNNFQPWKECDIKICFMRNFEAWRWNLSISAFLQFNLNLISVQDGTTCLINNFVKENKTRANVLISTQIERALPSSSACWVARKNFIVSLYLCDGRGRKLCLSENEWQQRKFIK